MTFDEWVKKQGFTEEDLSGPLHELEGCWRHATLTERKGCSNIINQSRSEVELMVGKMTTHEWSKVSSLLKELQYRFLWRKLNDMENG